MIFNKFFCTMYSENFNKNTFYFCSSFFVLFFKDFDLKSGIQWR